MTWLDTLQIGWLVAGAALSVGIASVAFRARSVAGTRTFGWLSLATADWSMATVLHLTAGAIDEKVVFAKVQYVGIAAVPALWYVFARQYARTERHTPWRVLAAVWVVPVVIVLGAWTNDAHHLLWRDVLPAGGRRLVYVHGPLFWINLAAAYLLLGLGSLHLVDAARQPDDPNRSRQATLAVGVALPWIGNVLYVSGALPLAGFDPTPLAFTASAACLAWGVLRGGVLEVGPTAREVLFETMPDAAFVLDRDGRVLDVNAAAAALVGGRRLTGRRLDTVFRDWPDRLTGDGPHRTRRVEAEAGGRTFDLVVTPVRDDRDRPVGSLVVARDVTDERRARAERTVLDERLRAQQHSDSLRVLAGGLAHDFNNLLTAVVGNADLLRARLADAPADLRDSIEAIIAGGERAADLVEKMVAYTGGARTMPGPVRLELVIPDLIQLVTHASADEIAVVWRPRGPVPAFVADATQLEQVVMNLVVNAIEATPAGHGEITITTGVEVLDLPRLAAMPHAADLPGGEYVCIEVVDRGTGMDAATVSRAFDPFFTTKRTGSGLGLAASQGIVRAHRGIITAESRPGAGSTFRVWLPFVSVDGPTIMRDE